MVEDGIVIELFKGVYTEINKSKRSAISGLKEEFKVIRKLYLKERSENIRLRLILEAKERHEARNGPSWWGQEIEEERNGLRPAGEERKTIPPS